MMAATARMMSAYVVDMRWGASLSPSAALDLRKAESMPSGSRISALHGAVFDHQAARRDAGHGDVGLERVRAGPDRIPGDDVDGEAAGERQVQPLGEGRKPRVRLDLQLVPGHRHAVQAQSVDAHEHRRPCAVVEREAETMVLGAEAV